MQIGDQTKHIMVVNDDPAILQLFEDLLRPIRLPRHPGLAAWFGLLGLLTEIMGTAPKLADMLTRRPRVIDAVGRTSVGELMALIESAALVVASDSAALLGRD